MSIVLRAVDEDGLVSTCIYPNSDRGHSGIIEAATAGTPSVNIGPRQDGREPSGSAVVSAGETLASIRAAIRRARRRRPIMGRSTVYGDGTAGGRIATLLADVPLSDAFRRKANAY